MCNFKGQIVYKDFSTNFIKNSIWFYLCFINLQNKVECIYLNRVTFLFVAWYVNDKSIWSFVKKNNRWKLLIA